MAANVINSALCCLNTQIALDALASTPAARVDSNGMLEALRSAENKVGFTQMTDAVEESKRKPTTGQTPASVEVKVRKPSCLTVLETEGNLCDSGTATSDPYDYVEPTVDLVARLNGSMTAIEFDALCTGADERRVIVLEDFANDILENVNEQLINSAYAALGDYSDGTASTGVGVQEIPLINTLGHLNSAAYAKISAEMRKQKFTGRPIFVGGEKLALSQDILPLGGTGTSRNVDVNAHKSVVSPYYDNQIDGLVGTLQTDPGESFGMAWATGSFQFLEWYRNTGLFENFKEDYAETTITIRGMKFDYSIKYDECNHKWDFTLQKRFGLFYQPDANYACNVGTGKVLYKLGCGDIDCNTF